MRRRAAIVVVSDRAARGERADRTAPLLREDLAAAGYEVAAVEVVEDEVGAIEAAIRRNVGGEPTLVVTTGGTGPAPRDVTPEATRRVVERELPGFGERMRAVSIEETPFAVLSRQTAGVAGRSLVVNLPGSPRGARTCLAAVLPACAHALAVLAGESIDCDPQSGAP